MIHTTPNESLDSLLKFSGGAGPGGVIGRGRRVGIVTGGRQRGQGGMVFFAVQSYFRVLYDILCPFVVL
jgi:hypothetical protein